VHNRAIEKGYLRDDNSDFIKQGHVMTVAELLHHLHTTTYLGATVKHYMAKEMDPAILPSPHGNRK